VRVIAEIDEDLRSGRGGGLVKLFVKEVHRESGGQGCGRDLCAAVVGHVVVRYGHAASHLRVA
jgi:hypothetical protein